MPVDYLSCFVVVLRGIHMTINIFQTDYSVHLRLQIFPLFWSHTRKCDIWANESLIKIKEKWSAIQFDVFVLSFSSFQWPRQ